MIYTYLLQSKKDKKWYTGCTNDLRKRFKLHNENQIRATKHRGPFQLVYYEACLDEQDAFAREKYLKSGPGKHYLKNRLKRFLSLTGLAADLAQSADSAGNSGRTKILIYYNNK
jgi:putative endonuclease